ncbi:MAG TPA: GNAT family N-acetyltransferase [Candidatus Dormibacteraeota bacterium]
MPDTGFVELRTERLLLRRFRVDDLDAFVAYRSDPGIARYQGWGPGYTREQGEAFIAWARGADPDTPGEWFQFAIERREVRGLIGDCAARFEDAGVEVGFTLAAAQQGRGYATEAVAALLGYVRGRGHHRVVAWCDRDNHSAQRVLARLHFTLEATEAQELRFGLEQWIRAPRRSRDGA